MTKPREKKREELQAEIEDGEEEIRQLENREKVLRAKVIPRGTPDAQPPAGRPRRSLESIVPEAKTMTMRKRRAFSGLP